MFVFTWVKISPGGCPVESKVALQCGCSPTHTPEDGYYIRNTQKTASVGKDAEKVEPLQLWRM